MRIISILILLTMFIVITQDELYSSENEIKRNEELSLPLGLTLSVIPGFGAGNYYANNFSKGLTFTFLDTSLTGISVWAYTSTKVTDYSVISIGIIPAVLLLFKVIQFKTVYDDIEAYNSRYIFKKP